MSTPASTETAGLAFNETVTATDNWGNTVTSYTGTQPQCITFSGPGQSPNGTAPIYPAGAGCTSGSTLTFTNGASTASIKLFAAQSNTILTATQAQVTGSSGAFTVNSGPATSVAIPTSPGTETAGSSFGLTMNANDTYGNPYGGTLTVTFSGASNSPTPSNRAPAYPASVAFSNGSASPSITLYDAQANIQLTATTTGAGSATSPAFSVNPAGASQLLFTTQPGGSVIEGVAFTQPVLTAYDPYSNVATGFGSAVTLQVAGYTAGNGGSTQGSIAGCTNPVTAVNGVATFSGCAITGTAGAGTYTFKGTGGVLTSTTSTGTVTITGGATATQLVFSTQPGGSVAEGTAFTQPVVTAKDANGNTVSGVGVTLAIAGYTAGNGGSTQGNLSCTTNPVTTSASGAASFAGCSHHWSDGRRHLYVEGHRCRGPERDGHGHDHHHGWTRQPIDVHEPAGGHRR